MKKPKVKKTQQSKRKRNNKPKKRKRVTLKRNCKKVVFYDTSLRDGEQKEGISRSVADKLKITQKVSEVGFISYVEGGWPGSNLTDKEYFREVQKMDMKGMKIAAFGSTVKPNTKVEESEDLKELIESGATTVTIFGKAWDLHVRLLDITLSENLRLIKKTIRYLKRHKVKVFFDAEHYFDGYKENPEYAQKVIKTAERAGASCIVLCDTNGGSLPDEIKKGVKAAKKILNTEIGIHAHNDKELAVANSLAAVEAGATHIQGTINGYGERCGNANLVTLIFIICEDLKKKTERSGQLDRLRELSRFVDEVTNIDHDRSLPLVGDNAFLHKGGVHVYFVQKDPRTYEHTEPEKIGNTRRFVASSVSGKSNLRVKAEEFGIDLLYDSPKFEMILKEVKRLENKGFQFDAADASLELLMRKMNGEQCLNYFELKGFRVIVEKTGDGETRCEATIKVIVNGQTEHTAANGVGPVNALDNALRKALLKFYPELKKMRLVDYKVRVLNTNGNKGTAKPVRVLIESANHHSEWGNVGFHENIVEASYNSLAESIEYFLSKEERGDNGEKEEKT